MAKIKCSLDTSNHVCDVEIDGEPCGDVESMSVYKYADASDCDESGSPKIKYGVSISGSEDMPTGMKKHTTVYASETGNIARIFQC